MSKKKVKIIEVNLKNIKEYPATCFMKDDDPGYKMKLEWLKKRFKEGLKVKLLYIDEAKKPNGYIEYIPGNKAYRAIEAPGYMFIHCIWMNPNKYKRKGYGSLLIREAEKDAKAKKMKGVAVIASEGSFMAGKDIFLQNKFKVIEETEPSFSLLTKSFKKGPLPKIKDWQKELKKYKGLNIVYTRQCPWALRFIKNDLNKLKKKYKLKIKMKELETAKEAQNSPSIYTSFNVINNGQLLADHYISARRFENIIKKEIKK